MKVEIINPHGLCAGVNAAIAKALTLKNVYCLHQLVHSEIVVDELRSLGYRFVESLKEVPRGATVVFSAHGVSPAVREEAKRRELKIVDTTCPFVAKVHRQAREYAAKGLPVIVLGDKAHIETQGILGECIGAPKPKRGARVGVVAQTTLNADEVMRETEKLKRQYEIVAEPQVCNATRERQQAVRAYDGEAVLVLGSANSSNARRLCEVAEDSGKRAFLAGSMAELDKLDFGEIERLGVTSAASTPERFFDEAIRHLRKLPRHLAIIMDGNGRWATKRGKRRGEGHIAGAKALAKVLEWCGERGIKYLTVYAFSTENWQRPKAEVEGLMKLFVKMLRSKTLDFIKNRVRFRMIGRRGDLPRTLVSEIERLEARTKQFERQFIVAISYGGRAEIIDAANAAIAAGKQITEETFRDFLYAGDVPDPDLVIRTSGEQRTSNFLLWESAYSEYYFTDVLWPDFTEAELERALLAYASRKRRHGGV